MTIKKAKSRWDSQRKAHEGDTIIFLNKPKLDLFARNHTGHEGTVVDSKYRTGKTGLSIKRMYLTACNKCNQQDWIMSSSFNKA